ncbi:hypothetical protein L593_07220 [Salinarchaeum sp. Harcht-Bsk1]|uniref:hypothetical protein n=1 Tax=Salinarchaeum sp. Harcht-Bsk1 TaxID=1333523 RepID=UPI0003424183|nr:hypothetical protein [Salinarchaeum sp. Harcht-Bsk1]AGN01391.1 hypothetical protein L593_07220 [Salinarchaeum sp. Harcht-Bsk1]
MPRYSVGRILGLGGGGICVLGLVLATLGTLQIGGWRIAPLLGLLWPPTGLAIGAIGLRIAGSRASGDVLAVYGGMGAHLFALSLVLLTGGGWLLGGGSGRLVAAVAWGAAALLYGGFAYAWERTTPTDVDAAWRDWRR